MKRAGGEPDQFLPLVNVALASWLARASQVARTELDALKSACSMAGVSRVARTDLPCVVPFACDGSVLLPAPEPLAIELFYLLLIRDGDTLAVCGAPPRAIDGGSRRLRV